jgi:hypothetical protein
MGKFDDWWWGGLGARKDVGPAFANMIPKAPVPNVNCFISTFKKSQHLWTICALCIFLVSS